MMTTTTTTRRRSSSAIRLTYRNGDPIALSCGCDGCSPSRINGVLVHEAGCPDAWRDYAIECPECGQVFFRSDRDQCFCGEHCAAVFYGAWCDCEDCRAMREEEEGEEETDCEVIVGNIGTAYAGPDEAEARRKYAAYVADSKTGLGRSGGESVVLIVNGEVVEEYEGTLNEEGEE